MFIEPVATSNDDAGSNKENVENFFDGESDNDSKPSLENVEMRVDQKNFIYYMTKT